MKTLILSALLCAVIALTRAAALSEAKDEGGEVAIIQGGEHHILERSTCPRGWTKISGRCFLFIPRTLSWAQAERNCLSLGANLASVRRAEEYHGIQRLISDKTHGSPQAWLGASDGAEEAFWFWTDGTPFTFSYWCKGEPNNLRGQHCIQMNHGDNKCWDDAQCHSHLPSVCVKKTG